MCMHIFPAFSVCGTMFGPGARGHQRRVLNLLEPEIHMIITYHVGVGNQTLVLCNSSQCPYLLSHCSSL